MSATGYEPDMYVDWPCLVSDRKILPTHRQKIQTCFQKAPPAKSEQVTPYNLIVSRSILINHISETRYYNIA